MSILKPNLCAWFFHTWEHVKKMNNMICKRQEINMILNNFNISFQLEATKVNDMTPLFLINLDLEIRQQEKMKR